MPLATGRPGQSALGSLLFARRLPIRIQIKLLDRCGLGRWSIRANPVAAIPTDKQALRVGERFLTLTEFRLFWMWLVANRARSASAPAVQLIMATGQRVQEILQLTESHYERAEHLLSWKKTKNGLPHSLPLPDIAAELLDSLVANEFGFFFPIGSIRRDMRSTPRRTSYASCMLPKQQPSASRRVTYVGLGRRLRAALVFPRRCGIASKII
jgi:integrase